MTFIRIASGVLLAAALGIASASAEPVKLIFATIAPADSLAAKGLIHPFADRINEAGKDVVQIDIRDGFAIANFDNIYSRVQDDVVQIGFALQGAIGGKFVRSAIVGLPFVSDDSATGSVAFWRLYQSGALDAEYGDIVPLVLIAFPQSGIHLTRPVTTLDDLHGLKLIALGRVQSQAVTALGGAPLSIAPSDMHEALQRGTADGAVASWPSFDPFRLDEVTHYHLETRLGTSTMMIFMAKKRFDALPAAAQKVLRENSGEAASRTFGAYFDNDAIRIRNSLKQASGQSLAAPDAKRKTAWAEKIEPIDTAYAASVPNGAVILDQYRQLLTAAKAK